MKTEYLGGFKITDKRRQHLLIEKIWITSDGELIVVKAMETSHLRNSILCLKQFKYEKYFRDWTRILNQELTRRKKKRHGTR